MPIETIMLIGIVVNLTVPLVTMVVVCEMFCRDDPPPPEDDE